MLVLAGAVLIEAAGPDGCAGIRGIPGGDAEEAEKAALGRQKTGSNRAAAMETAEDEFVGRVSWV